MFHSRSFTLKELADLTCSKLVGNPEHRIFDVADLENATAQDASFLSNARYENAMRRSHAGVIFISQQSLVISKQNFLVNENPSLAFQKTVDAFHREGIVTAFAGIQATAIIHPTAKIGKEVSIGPYTVIDQNVQIGDGSKIGAGCYIGPFSTIGKQCLLHTNISIRERCQIGDRVILQPGVVIGSCGFGYLTDKQGKHSKLNQVGIVVIEDDVEIGANTTIDRARFKETRIGKGTKIDNLVQIGHGVTVGEDNIIVAQTGIAGSTKTGKNVVLGGQVAVAGHLEIGDQVMIAGRSGISKSLPEAGKYGGVPAMPLQEYNRMSVYLRNIESYVDEIKALKNRLEALEKKDS